MTTLAAELDSTVARGEGRPLAAGAPAPDDDAWERFLAERTREGASPRLGRWRDEEGL